MGYYEHALRAWRRRNRAPFAVALLMATAFAVPVWIYFPLGEFYAGLILGGFVGMIVWVRDDPPEFIAKWKRGAEGERQTGRVLKRLEQHGWHSVHDRAGKYGNLDHIVVGPGGIFLLDSKNLSGTVMLAEAGLKTDYADAPRDGFTHTSLAGAMRGASAHLKDRIAATTELTGWVQAVVVIWGHFPEAEAERDKVVYVSGDHLEAWLSRQPDRLSPRDQQLIRLGLDAEIVVRRAEPLVAAAEPE
jgi:hypothetical protein